MLIDLSVAALASRAALNRLGRLADAGVTVTIRGDEAALDELVAAGLPASASNSACPENTQPTWSCGLSLRHSKRVPWLRMTPLDPGPSRP